LHYSAVLDAHLHAVPLSRIVKHHRPKQRLQDLMQAKQHDAIESDLFQLCKLLQQGGLDLSQTGITGSVLIGAQQASSDIDLVCYSRAVFHQCRDITRELIKLQHLHELDEQDWQASYERRSCDLSYSDYVWHERRKYNKAVINGRKFDLNFINDTSNQDLTRYQKCESITLKCIITDDTQGFDYPAEFKIAHEQIDAIVCFTATYTGQALKGETVLVSGIVEQNQHGVKRIVVGSSREAHGEYIKVLRV
jgi:predicted nucleotidyltransferase